MEQRPGMKLAIAVTSSSDEQGYRPDRGWSVDHHLATICGPIRFPDGTVETIRERATPMCTDEDG
jgi:hypothetical protein